ncbi:MAG: protein-glutamate O-methyltransferase CheR [Myxococcaceae bacterium]|nr:protein-glutamate O-methyltransferase CheR [Myxococcaceae bacterium]
MPEPTQSWNALRSFMATTCGVALADDQSYLMEARLSPVAKTLNYRTVDEYVLEAVRPGAPNRVTAPLIDAMTTHETYWFRDTPFWKALQEQVIPRLGLTEPGSNRAFTIWLAACSTGQEVYSLTMFLEENFPLLHQRTTIIATDVSEAAVQQAKAGVYTVFEANRGLSAPRLVKHFERAGANFKVKEHLRRKVTFVTHNLVTQAPPGVGFDLVLMRNVLIYFPEPTRRAVVQRAMGVMKPNGLLGIGATELLTLPSLSPGWYPRSP